jgi:hypothetical protein
MSQSDYIKHLKTSTVLKNQKELNPVLESANYTLYKEYTIANTVKNTLPLYEQLPLEGITNIFNMPLKNVANCPVFIECINTNTRENRKPLSSVYFTPHPVIKIDKTIDKYQCSACCYDTSINGLNNKKSNFFNTNFTKYSSYRLRKILCEKCKKVLKPSIPILSVAPASNSITVTITNKEENVTYKYSINGGQDTDVTFDDTNNPTFFTITDNINGNTEYNLKVKAINDSGSVESNSYTVKTKPSIPSIFVIANSNSLFVTITNKEENIIYRYSINGGEDTDVTFDDTNNPTFFSITDNINGNTYYNVIVSATNTSGKTDSEPYDVTTL